MCITARIIKLKMAGEPPYCAWLFVIDNQTFNIAFPDSNAAYWSTRQQSVARF
ncbi:MAG: hypothetical protein LJE69_10350 [Thiohalocapsa sp.]|uniref:hypothetical protein n=1 Tax=Thiohalocapsa sp. TaxID=2497641 RepID=UPI0025CF2539|nr:hypothetical protein [Thiohalocapsa sp.]MCG6941637.1 hypothetical protein [Thiohalocapsa sp.]